MALYRISNTLNPLNSISGGSRTTDGEFQGQSQSPITTSVYLSLEVGSGSIAACRDGYDPDMVHTEYTILLGENVNIFLFEHYLRGIKWMKKIDSDEVRNDIIKRYGDRIVFTDNDEDQCDVEGYNDDYDDGNYSLLRFFVHTNYDMDYVDYAELTKAVRRFEDDEKLGKAVWRGSRAVMRRCQQVCKDGFGEGLMIVLQAELDAEAKQRADRESA